MHNVSLSHLHHVLHTLIANAWYVYIFHTVRFCISNCAWDTAVSTCFLMLKLAYVFVDHALLYTCWILACTGVRCSGCLARQTVCHRQLVHSVQMRQAAVVGVVVLLQLC
jgi:hypothetical protein